MSSARSFRHGQNILSTLANSPSGLSVRSKRLVKKSRFQRLAFGGAIPKRRASRSRAFGRGRETTGWPKDKHRLSTAVKVFSCKCALLGLARPKSIKPLILIYLKPVDQQRGLWITGDSVSQAKHTLGEGVRHNEVAGDAY